MAQPLAFLNGEMVPADQAVLPVSDAGIVQGATVSETLRTFGHELFRLDDHLWRFANSLETVGFDIGLSSDELAGICRDVVAHNSVATAQDNDLGLVLFATAGPYATYSGQVAGSVPSTPSVCVHTFPLPFELWSDMQSTGLHLVTSAVRQLPRSCIDPAIKHRSRLHYYLADRQASVAAPGARAVLLDSDGRLTETAAASFLLFDDSGVVSPESDSVLPSISVAVVEELCEAAGIGFSHRELRPDDVSDATEAFVATTPYCLAPVTSFNNAPVGRGEPGPVYDQLMTAWSQMVDVDIRLQVQQQATFRLEAASMTPTANQEAGKRE